MKLVKTLLILFAFISQAYAIPWRAPNEKIIFGNGTSAEIEFVVPGTNPIFKGTNGYLESNVPMYIGAGSKDASAAAQIDSTTGGFLPPRMTTAQRDAISTPAEGLTIVNTTTGAIESFLGSVWTSLVSTFSPMDNVVINSNFRLWQRGTSASNSQQYLADRFVVRDSSGSFTVSREASEITNKEFRLAMTSNAASNAFLQVGTQIEYSDFFEYIGDEVTARINMRAINANPGSTEVDFDVYCNTAQDLSIIFGGGAGTTNPVSQSQTITTGATDYSFTFTIPSDCKSLFLQIGTDSTVADTNSGDGFYIEWFTLYEGSLDKDYRTRGRGQGEELRLAQRYYEKNMPLDSPPGSVSTTGALQFLQAATSYRLSFQYMVKKRIATPSGAIWAPATGAINNVTNRSAADANQACNAGDIGDSFISISCNLTANNHYSVNWTSSAEF